MIFVTGGAITPSTRAFLAHSGRPILEKPFDPEALRALVEALV
jgi:hypothetical protein